MESPNADQSLKRKRSPNTQEDARLHPPATTIIGNATPGNVTQINYLFKARSEKLGLVQGDTETFGDVLGMIDEYEGMYYGHGICISMMLRF